jgi:transposase-like protein
METTQQPPSCSQRFDDLEEPLRRMLYDEKLTPRDAKQQLGIRSNGTLRDWIRRLKIKHGPYPLANQRREEIEKNVYQAIWVDRLSTPEARRKYGFKTTLNDFIQELRAKYGDPPPCRCGRAAVHSGACVGSGGKGKNPKCPECGSPSKKSGRKDIARGDASMREQRYTCCNCARNFGQFDRHRASLKELGPKLYKLIWQDHEKQTYAAAHLGIGISTVAKWIKKLKRKYGPVPACPCGRPGLHGGPCRLPDDPDTVRLSFVLRSGKVFRSRQQIDAAMTAADRERAA